MVRVYVVSQGTGSVQEGTSVADALIRLCVSAFTSDRRLADVAGDVIARMPRHTRAGSH